MPWTYILECADGTFYVGSTYDLERRISEHNEGLGASYTRLRRRRPVRLAWAGEFDRIEDAFLYEKQIQGWSRAKRNALIQGRFGDLPDLASRPARDHRRPPDGLSRPDHALPSVAGFEARFARTSTTGGRPRSGG